MMSRDELLSRFLDADLSETEKQEFESLLQKDEGLREDFLTLQATKKAMRKAAFYPAPEGLRNRILASIPEPKPNPSGLLSQIRTWFCLPWMRPAAVFAAVVALILIVPFSREKSSMAFGSRLAQGMIGNHRVCAAPELLEHHFVMSNGALLAAQLQEVFPETFSIPDLADIGWDLVEGHVCRIYGMPCFHIFYQNNKGERISYFIVLKAEVEGVLGKPIGSVAEGCYCPGQSPGDREGHSERCVLWRDTSGRICTVVGAAPREELSNLVTHRFPILKVAKESSGS